MLCTPRSSARVLTLSPAMAVSSPVPGVRISLRTPPSCRGVMSTAEGPRQATNHFESKPKIYLVFLKKWQDFMLLYNRYLWTPESPVIWDIKFHNLFPFAWKHLKIRQKGTNYEILKLNNRRLGRLKIHFIYQKSLVLMGETLLKKSILSDQSF